MNKKKIIPIVICLLVVIIAIFSMGGKKIVLNWESIPVEEEVLDSIELKVYVENSGSMNAYMCSGSNLKDAVFDYASDISSKIATSTSLFYINSQIIPYRNDLRSYIKDLTPQSFAAAGGNTANTDLREIFNLILENHARNCVSMFVSDCILDIPQSATDFFGNCQVSIKNSFNKALAENPELGVIIMKLDSKFDGYWYCGSNKQLLTNVKRPYYIWLIGNKKTLAEINKKVPASEIIGGIKEYCAYSGSSSIPFNIDKKNYVINSSGKIDVSVLMNLSNTLQNELILTSLSQYRLSNENQSSIIGIRKITDSESLYSHVIELEIENPETLREETLTFSYPYLQSWVENSNDTTGLNVTENMDKTTGILYLIKGVAEAYKSSVDYGSINFEIKNK